MISRFCFAFAATICLAGAQSFVGTIEVLKPETLEISVRPDKGEPRVLKIIAESIFQRIAPGAKDLKSAKPINASDIATGDRVLVSVEPGTSDLRRLVVMPASDIAKRDEEDRADWQKRGVAGVVVGKKVDAITIKSRALTGEEETVLHVTPATGYRRYSPDSVRFADASVSNLAEISPGDQLRARGERATDHSLTAGEVVFGTFLTKAGKIAGIDPQNGRITITELGSNKTFEVRLTADSQIKEMPRFGVGSPPGAPPGMMAPGSGGPPNGGGPPAGMRAPDIGQMLERLPRIPVEKLQAGDTVVLSSTKPIQADGPLTAIVLVSGADMLIQMARMQQPKGGAGATGGMPGGAGGGLSLGGLEGFPSVVP